MLLDKVLIGSGGGLLLIILLYYFRKGLILALIRLIYGEYSFEYLDRYKKFYIKSPFHYCFRDDFVAHLLYVLNKKEEIPVFKSHEDIYFENTPYFINYKKLLKDKGKPYCFNAYNFNHIGFEIKALGYRTKILGSKAILVFYFMNDQFFMGEYIFKNPRTNIKEKISEQFLENQELNEDNFYIENTKDRIIHFQNTGFTVDIKYFNKENPQIVRNLSEYFNFITGKKRSAGS
jgi:hypothetical protein